MMRWLQSTTLMYNTELIVFGVVCAAIGILAGFIFDFVIDKGKE